MHTKKLLLMFLLLLIILFKQPAPVSAFEERPVLVVIATQYNSPDLDLFYLEIKRRLFFPKFKVLPLKVTNQLIKAKQPLSSESLNKLFPLQNQELLIFLNLEKYEQHLTNTAFASEDDYISTNLRMSSYFYDRQKNIFLYKTLEHQQIDYILNSNSISDLVREHLRIILNDYLLKLKEPN